LLREETLLRLHDRQLELVRRWRAARLAGSQAPDLLRDLLVTVNAIAACLGTTG